MSFISDGEQAVCQGEGRRTAQCFQGFEPFDSSAGGKKGHRAVIGCQCGVSVRRSAGIGGQDAAHPLHAAVELGDWDALVRIVDASGVVAGEGEG